MCESQETSAIEKTPPQVVIPNASVETPAAEAPDPQTDKVVFVKAGPVPIYFNAKDVTAEREKELLKKYRCADGNPADGIGLELMSNGSIGVAFWRSEPTEKEPKAGHWEHHASLSMPQLIDFHTCFQLYDRMASIQKDLSGDARALESKGKKGIALLIDDRFRRKFAQLTHVQMKMCNAFRKVWFKREDRI